MKKKYILILIHLASYTFVCNANNIQASKDTLCVSCNEKKEWNITLPFSFNFYGNISSNLRIGCNGVVRFDTITGNINASNRCLATTSVNNIISVYWDSLTCADSIFYKTSGDSPDRQFIIEWRKYNPHVVRNPAKIKLILHETSNVIQFKYNEAEFEEILFDHDTFATIGIRKDKNKYQQYSSGLSLLGYSSMSKCIWYIPTNNNCSGYIELDNKWFEESIDTKSFSYDRNDDLILSMPFYFHLDGNNSLLNEVFTLCKLYTQNSNGLTVGTYSKNNQIFYTIQDKYESSNYKLLITNYLGEALYLDNTSNRNGSIMMKNCNYGIYFLVIENNKNQVAVSKFIYFQDHLN